MKDMLGRDELMTAEEALGLLLKHSPFKRAAEVLMPIGKAFKMVLSKDIFSLEDLPSFDRSTVDGFAVDSADTFGATESMPAYLNIAGEILMGGKAGFTIKKGECAKIPTGGMLPEGADSVVMYEHTQQVNETVIEILKPVSPAENVIRTGEDARKGECVLKRGHVLRPQDIGALAGLGITDIPVYEKPRVAIISTGDEIVAADKPLMPGQVRDINSYTLSGLISDAGGMPLRKGIFSDSYEIIREVVESSLEDSEMVLVSGGSSVGARDLTAGIINDLGAPGVLFHGVALKPGKPLIGGVINGVPVFGIPGHPAAVSVCFEMFIRPLLKIQSGCTESSLVEDKKIIKARMARNISSSLGREEHVGVALEERDGEIWAIPMLGKSGLITTMTKADGIAVIPLRKSGVQRGESVQVRLF